MSTDHMTNKRPSKNTRYKDSFEFIKLLETHSKKSGPEIYEIIQISRQSYSLLKLGKRGLTREFIRKVSPKIKALGITKDTYKKICSQSLINILSF